MPQSTGAGAAALLAIPSACLLVLRRAAPAVRGLTLFLVPLLVGVGWISFGGVSDTFEAGRALLSAFTALVMLLSGASLGQRGRRVLARGAVCIALILLVPAHLDRADGWTGILGNTGSVSEAALAGALVGAFFLARETTPWRVLGAAALVLHVAYSARVPVIAGVLSLSAALAAAAALARALPRAWRIAYAAIAVSACLTLLVSIAAPGTAALSVAPAVTNRDEPPPAASGGAAPSEASIGASTPDISAQGHTGGFEVRARIWWASLRMLGDHALLGLGPGQFATSFPAYRDPREIELTTLGRRIAGETEVEHPHNDWLAVALDAGVVGGLSWIAFLIILLAGAARKLRGEVPTEWPFAAAALGLCAQALVNAPLTSDAVSSSLAFAVFGCVLRDVGSERAVLARRFVVLCAAALLAVHAPRALAFVGHGRALHPLASATPPDVDGQTRALDAALDACPDSVLAARLRARLMEFERRDPALIHAAWLTVLSARPQHIEALVQLGLQAARAGSPGQARPYFRLALDLDPGHPIVLQNLVVLELEDGHIAAGLHYLERLSRTHPPSPEWVSGLAARLDLRGLERESDAVMERVDPKLLLLGPEEAYALSKAERQKEHALLADALESRAQRTWAREHMRAERYKDAVRLYRQSLRITRDYAEGGALRLRLELAAALLASGKGPEAQAEISGLAPKAADWAALPAFAGERLRATGWFTEDPRQTEKLEGSNRDHHEITPDVRHP